MPGLWRRRPESFPRRPGDIQGQRVLHHRLRASQAAKRKFREQGARKGIGIVLQWQRVILRQLNVWRQRFLRGRFLVNAGSGRCGRRFSLSAGSGTG